MSRKPDFAALTAVAKTVRGLSIDAVQKANSGHPGLPLGCADLGALLFGEALKHYPADPSWIDRDRFVLSAGHGSMFLYSLLHLSGYDISLDDLKGFRQLGTKAPGHPEFGMVPGVETTTGPLGAGFANAVGLALAESRLAATFNTAEHKLIDHYTYVLAGDGCMMEGVSAEAASLAGHLGLAKLIAFYDSNRITIEGKTDLAFTESVADRFVSYGWQVLHASGFDTRQLLEKIEEAKADSERPSLIIMETVIGFGSPNKAGTSEVHGSPLGPEEIKATKLNLGLDPDKDFDVSETVTEFFAQKRGDQKKAYDDWQKLFTAWARANPELNKLWDRHFAAVDTAAIEWPNFTVGQKLATRSAGNQCLQAIALHAPQLFGGSADLTPSTNTDLKGYGSYQRGKTDGRNIHFGVREHAMGSIVNGIVLHGGFRAYGSTFLVFADYMRPPIRLAALMKIPSVFVFTHDSLYVGEDGPTHQPVEHLASLRIIPGLETLRPADAEECAVAWEIALGKRAGHHPLHNPAAPQVMPPSFEAEYGPACIALSRQGIAVFEKPASWRQDCLRFGAYLVKGDAAAKVALLASGSEVNLALAAHGLLSKEGIQSKVISVLSLERYRAALKSKNAPETLQSGKDGRFAVEAGHYFSWAGLVDEENFLGMSSFAVSAPGDQAGRYFGLTPEVFAAKVKQAGL